MPAALTSGFCPRFNWDKPLCKGSGLESVRRPQASAWICCRSNPLSNPWVSIESPQDARCPISQVREFVAEVHGAASAVVPPNLREPAFSAAFAKLATPNPSLQVAPPPAALGDLPVIEVAAQPGGAVFRCIRHHHVRRWRLGGIGSGHRRRFKRERHSRGRLGFFALLLDPAHAG